MSLCGREREGWRERGREGDKERGGREGESRSGGRERERGKEKEREGGKEREGRRETEGDRGREREREGGREGGREKWIIWHSLLVTSGNLVKTSVNDFITDSQVTTRMIIIAGEREGGRKGERGRGREHGGREREEEEFEGRHKVQTP